VNSNWNSNQQIENREKEKELKQKKIEDWLTWPQPTAPAH
jgi:hypothetical protein